MKLNRGLMALCLVFIMVFSLAVMVQSQSEIDAWTQNVQDAVNQKLNGKVLSLLLNSPVPHFEVSAFWTATFSSQTIVSEKAPLPENNTRMEIYGFIRSNPGVQFRAICGGLGLSIGVVQFHLAQLKRSGLITSFRKGRYKRFFAAGKFSKAEMETIAAVRLGTVKSILQALLHGKHVSHHELAVNLKISSQGLTWQMHRLRDTGLIQETRNGLNVTYELKQNYVPLVTQTISLLQRD
ncbi:MAG: winged helix-turn-helix transcriptional regulator [Candidatus Bathyarchaeota archaeon]|nr:winged helix-turn-helix transcriptional regulator [Candidatus Bathyarchaeota archaeon]